VLLAEGLAHDGDGRDGLGTRGEIQLIPYLRNVDGDIQIIDEGLRHLDKRLRQQRHAVRLLLHEVQHLERGGAEGEVHLPNEMILLEHVLKRVLRRAALADGIDGAPGEILYGLDGRIGRHDVEQTEVADADDLDLFVHVECVAVGLQIQLDDLDRRVVEVDAGLAGNLPDRDAR